MRLGLSSEQNRLRSEAESFCRSVQPLVDAEPALARQGVPSDGDSRAVYRALGEAGWIGVAWPERYGGRGRTHLDATLVEEVLGYHWLPLSQYLLSCKTIGAALLEYATDELKERLLPAISSGRLIFCQGFSEPNAGSDLASLGTKAVLDGNRFVVNGHKIWTSGAEVSDWIYLAVRTDANAHKHRGISVLVCDMPAPGITVRTFPTMGGGDLCEVFLDKVEVPASQLVGDLNGGWSVVMHTLDYERITAEKVGCIQWLLDNLSGRVDQSLLLELNGELAACRLLSRRAAWMLDEKLDASAASAMAKLTTGTLMQKTASSVVDALGIAGLEDASGVLRGRAAALYRASVATTISGGSAEIQRMVIARRGLGLGAA